ncbi:hypothetical protein ERICIV_01613 [Paenibacillus larvae subsp. larvae]|uniref:Uncharacterized protein n=2 Tax=Paenibacillus larvae TaxID=1464 RepID=A0A2L1TYM0_9BACL|nr:hypothetical protein [Paenibacillus larvae]AQT86249.1 hypothetical protein B1222_20425 [Paenibacillus larvae subsp. pulvifaciens]AVF25777.1 hypothetical protein ERICIII_01592 [Paenibacillus larvae subsp. larvae]AQZ47882.1 hypothetical protein B5S25_16105 [Paenibacillus larvae subsp. pulvifaciens]AVF30554.1 hypothetical protein ERICIV_01613 [Paenibacillus larvae subsp. larvae]MCY9508805.1 hypothetical protein [Paenibacillus larvae]
MKMRRWFIYSCLIAGMGCMMLYIIPWLDANVSERMESRWSQGRTLQMTEQNLPDFIVRLPVQLRIRKVELTHSILSLDLHMPKYADELTVYQDLHTIAKYAAEHTDNINRVLVRVLDYSPENNQQANAQLLIAMDATRENANSLPVELPVPQSAETARESLQSKVSLIFTDTWIKRYLNL